MRELYRTLCDSVCYGSITYATSQKKQKHFFFLLSLQAPELDHLFGRLLPRRPLWSVSRDNTKLQTNFQTKQCCSCHRIHLHVYRRFVPSGFGWFWIFLLEKDFIEVTFKIVLYLDWISLEYCQTHFELYTRRVLNKIFTTYYALLKLINNLSSKNKENHNRGPITRFSAPTHKRSNEHPLHCHIVNSHSWSSQGRKDVCRYQNSINVLNTLPNDYAADQQYQTSCRLRDKLNWL